ncbi:MAG: rhomboid family intramembrane serine protease [Bacteroidales bacterium]
MSNTSFDQFKYFFRQKTILVQLIKINIAVWLFIVIVSLFSFLLQQDISGNVIDWLALPSSVDKLISRPWTIITYMFLHKDFFHILFNMMMLFFGGLLFTQYIGIKKLLQTYLWGGISGGVFYIASYNLFPAFNQIVGFSSALGASASVIAVVIAVAVYKPDAEVQLMFFGNVKLKYIAIGLMILDIVSIEKGNSGGHIAHIGGAFYGLLMALNLKYQYLVLADFKMGNPFKRKPKMKFYKNENPPRPVSDDEYNRKKAENQKRTDAILDKISKSGYDNLTKEEKEFLFNSSSHK